MTSIWEVIYWSRRVVTGFSLLFILYCGISAWYVVPFTDFDFRWDPDSQLNIHEVPLESLAINRLEAGDIVRQIDGVDVHRSARVFTDSSKSSYTYTVVREEELVIVDVPSSGEVTYIGLAYRLPTTALTLGFWVVGLFMVHYAKKENHTAFLVAYIFIGLAVALAGVQAELLSVTGAWVSRLFLVFTRGWYPLSWICAADDAFTKVPSKSLSLVIGNCRNFRCSSVFLKP